MEEDQAAGRETIAPSAARLLEIALGAGGEIEVQDETHIGSIHPHAKGHRGHQDRRLVLLEMGQSQGTTLRIHTGVIGDGLHPVVAQALRPALTERRVRA